MKKKLYIPLFVILIIIFFKLNKKQDAPCFDYKEYTIFERPSTRVKPCLNLHSKSAILYDKTSNQILYSHNENMRLPNASTTKIMTCITALEQCSLDEVVPVSTYAASMPKVKLGMNKGDSYYLKDLLYSLMLESHNDSAACIAEYVGTKLSNSKSNNIYDNNKELSLYNILNFTNLMTISAKQLGLKNTNFVTPNGLDDDNHYSSAKDLAYITSYALSNNIFCKIITTTQYRFSSLNNKKHTLTNINSFLNMYEGAIGCKTGFTSNAGYCFVGAVNKNNHTFISVVLGCGWPPNKKLKWTDTISLMNFGYSNYKDEILFSNNELNLSVPVYNSNKEITLMLASPITEYISPYDKITLNAYIPEFVTNTTCNKCVGYINVYINDFLYKKYPLYKKKPE